jgi:cell division protease FtsH
MSDDSGQERRPPPPPRGGPPGGRRRGGGEAQQRRLLANLLFAAILLAGLLLIGRVGPGAPEVREVPYSTFLQALDRGEAASVSIGPREVKWTTRVDEVESRFRSVRVPGVDEAELLTRLQAADVEFTGDAPSEWWPLALIWIVPTVLIVGVWIFLLRRMAAGGRAQALSFGQSRAKIWDEGTTQITFEDVAGVDEAVEELREVVDFLRRPERYGRVGARIPKGVLLVGPTGTGKTLLARATAGEAGVPFFTISGAEFVEMFVGVGAARVRDLFRQAREKAPCIVFIDEIDTLGKTRAGAGSPVSNEEREQTLNQLLVEIDGFDPSGGVILMAATNRPDLLDPALTRPGRFDRQISVDRPDLNGRQAILQVHARRVALDPEVDLRIVAARTPGFAGAQLANVINEAALLSVRRGRERITMADLEEAIDRVMAGLERSSRALIEKEQEIVAHHEMGHALLGMLLPKADPVHKVSIVPRGPTALGVTIQTPLEDRYLLTEGELLDRLAVILGGRAAEQVVFGETSTGAADDLARATELARRMVTQFGMAGGVGPLSLERPEGAETFWSHRPYSEDTARRVDEEIRRLVEESYDRAVDILETHEGALRTLAGELRVREVMDGPEIAGMLAELGVPLERKGEGPEKAPPVQGPPSGEATEPAGSAG